ncbi:MAG TPA: type 1 glutamine amidotransferase domain-containing protein [Actinomycetota bacterium]|nr:type 1 glutamine amidotransferase domain-containing protein [Actinomycetota bacterium]
MNEVMAMKPLEGKEILIFAGPDYEDMELQYPRYRLAEAGARITIAGIGEQTYHGKKGMPIDVDVQVTDVRAADFDALVIPGGYAPDKIRRVAEALEIVREMNDQGKTIGFICHAGWVPISAGVLKGRRITCVSAIKDDVVNAGAEYVNEPVVVDGNFVTSRTPEDLPVWLPALIERIAAQG